MLAVAFALRNASAVVFLGGTGLCLLTGLAFLYLGPLCTPRERAMLKNALDRVGGILGAKAVPQ